MKVKYLFLLLFVSIILTSCKKDYTNPENLSGTTWRYDFPASDVYHLFIFHSSNRVTERRVVGTSSQDFKYDYEVSDDAITFYYNGQDKVRTYGVIDGETITLEYTTNDVKWVLHLQ